MELHERIVQKMKEKKLRQVDLALATGKSKVAVLKWINGENVPKTDSLKKLAELFGVSDSWLMHGTEEKLDNNVVLSEKVPSDGRPVPVISWVAAGSFSPIETVLKDTEIEEYLPPNRRCGKNGYALKVVGYSMAPTFLPGDRIYVNPDIQTFDLKTDDLVIVACAGDSEATFKKLIIEGEGTSKFLEPLNPDWPDKIIKLSEDCRLVGKVVGLY
ncbi:peptidase S24, partial [Acinetobacter baumannii]